jgi:hypothetical protein
VLADLAGRRSEFDQMMLDNAREHGVKAFEGTRVLEVLFEGERAVGVKVRMKTARARSAGRGRGRRQRPELDDHEPAQAARVGSGPEQGAIWTYWEGAYRDTGKRRRRDAGLQTQGQEGLVLVHPAARRHRQRGRRRADFDYLFKNRGTVDHEKIYFEKSSAAPS